LVKTHSIGGQPTQRYIIYQLGSMLSTKIGITCKVQIMGRVQCKDIWWSDSVCVLEPTQPSSKEIMGKIFDDLVWTLSAVHVLEPTQPSLKWPYQPKSRISDRKIPNQVGLRLAWVDEQQDYSKLDYLQPSTNFVYFFFLWGGGVGLTS